MKKVLAAIFIVFIIVSIGLVFFIRSFVTADKVKAFLIPYAEEALNRKVSIGEVNISLLKGIDVRDFTIRENDEKTDFLKCKDLVLKFQLLPLLSRKVIVDELKIESPEVRITRDAKGRFNFEDIGKKKKLAVTKEIKTPDEEKALPMSLTVENVSVDNLTFSFIDSTKALPDMKGSFVLDARIKSVDGSILSSDGKATLRLDEILISQRPVGNFETGIDYILALDLEPGNIRIDKADVKIQGIPISITGGIKNYRKEPDIKMNLYARQLPIDKLIPMPAGAVQTAKTPAASRPASVSASKKEAEPLNLKMRAEGEIKLDSIIYRGMSMNDLYARYQLQDNRFEILKLTADAGKGRLNISGAADLSKPGYGYSLSANVDSLHAEEIVNAFFPKAKDAVFGLISFNLKTSGEGTRPAQIKKNLVADGNFTIKNGKITNAKATENLSKLLGIDELKTINLRQANGTIKIRNRIARLDSIFTSDDVSMDPSGDIGLDETLDLAFDLKLSKRLTDKAMSSGIAKYITNEEGWGVVPLKVSGAFSNPSYSVDIAKAGKRAIEKELDNVIDKIFNEDNGTGGDKTQQKKSPAGDLLKGLFR